MLDCETHPAAGHALQSAEFDQERPFMDGSTYPVKDHRHIANDFVISGKILSLFLNCPYRVSGSRLNWLKGLRLDKERYEASSKKHPTCVVYLLLDKTNSRRENEHRK